MAHVKVSRVVQVPGCGHDELSVAMESLAIDIGLSIPRRHFDCKTLCSLKGPGRDASVRKSGVWSLLHVLESEVPSIFASSSPVSILSLRVTKA